MKLLCKEVLADEEKAVLSKEVMSIIIEKERLEDDKKAAASAFKAKIDQANAEIRAKAMVLNNGYEMRMKECYSREQDGVISWYDPDTNEVVKTEPKAQQEQEIFNE